MLSRLRSSWTFADTRTLEKMVSKYLFTERPCENLRPQSTQLEMKLPMAIENNWQNMPLVSPKDHFFPL